MIESADLIAYTLTKQCGTETVFLLDPHPVVVSKRHDAFMIYPCLFYTTDDSPFPMPVGSKDSGVATKCHSTVHQYQEFIK